MLDPISKSIFLKHLVVWDYKGKLHLYLEGLL